jgi:hypothetical protein
MVIEHVWLIFFIGCGLGGLKLFLSTPNAPMDTKLRQTFYGGQKLPTMKTYF